MKFTVLNWLKEDLTPFVGKIIELFFRIILFLLPLGVYLLLIQYREKVSKISNISVYTNNESVWQHIYPGFALVAINPKATKRNIKRIKDNIQSVISANKYLIEVFFMLVILFFLFFKGVK